MHFSTFFSVFFGNISKSFKECVYIFMILVLKIFDIMKNVFNSVVLTK